MAEFNEEILDSSNQPGTESVPPKTPEAAPEEVAKLKHLKDSYYARAKQAEEEASKLKEKLAALEKNTPSAVLDDLRRDSEVTRLIAKGYNEEEASFVLKAGGLENPYVKAAIEAQRAKVKVEQAQPPASQVAAPTPTMPSMTELKGTERAKAWQNALDKAASRRAGQPV